MKEKKDRPKSAAARELGSLGGTARAKKLTQKRRRAIARYAAEVRWAKAKNLPLPEKPF